MPNIVDLARSVERAKAELDRANAALIAALNGSPIQSNYRRARRGPGSNSISQQVLAALQAAPSGLTRGELLALLPGHDAAVHSALKKHASDKRIHSEDGRWRYAWPSSSSPASDEKPAPPPAVIVRKKKGPQP